jgi:hypothetical protein
MPEYDVHAVLAALEAGQYIKIEEEVTLPCDQVHSGAVWHPAGHVQTVHRLVRLAESLTSPETTLESCECTCANCSGCTGTLT